MEFLFVGSMGSFDLAIELRGSWLDVDLADAVVLDMPMEPGLEFVPVDGADLLDPEGEGLDDVVDEVGGVCLGVPFVDFEGADPGRVIDGGELEPPELLAALIRKVQELDVHLDVAAGDLLVVALGVHLAHARAHWQPIETVAAQDTVDAGIRDPDAMVVLGTRRCAWGRGVVAAAQV